MKKNNFSVYAKYGALALLILMPALALYGSMNPWKPAETILKAYNQQTPILVGISYKANYTLTDTTKRTSRSYILFPMVFSQPKVITIAQVNEQEPVASESPYGIMLLLVCYIVCILITWKFWFQKRA